MGRPCLLTPKGQAVEGNPSTLIIAVYEKLNGLINGSWCNGAAVGWVGYKNTPFLPKISYNKMNSQKFIMVYHQGRKTGCFWSHAS